MRVIEHIQNLHPNFHASFFKEELSYQDGTTPQWGGNISEMSWGPGTEAKNYRFGYDALSRLVSADYSEGSAQASANARAGGLIGGGGIIGGEIGSGGHFESYHYDRNGNMDLHGRDNLMELIGVEGNRITSVGTKAISYDAKADRSPRHTASQLPLSTTSSTFRRSILSAMQIPR